MTNTQLLNKFKKELVKQNISEKTIRSYSYDINKFLRHYPNLSLNDVTKEHVKDFIKHDREVIGNTARSVSQYISALRKLYGIIRPNDNPTFGLDRILIEEQPPQFLSKDEINKFFNGIPEDNEFSLRDKTMFALMYSCGLKVGETVDLTLDKINVDNKTIKLIDRTVPISNDVLRLYTKYINARSIISNDPKNNYIFVSNKRCALDRRSVWRLLRKRGLKTDIDRPINTNILRHSYAIHLLEEGKDLSTISNLLGIDDIKNVYVYIKVVQQKMLDDIKMIDRGQRL